MAFAGDLETVNLPDVLQLLGTAEKTGALSIRRGNEEKRIYFDKGRPVFASSTNENEKIGSVLLKRKIVTNVDLEKARIYQNETGKRLGLALLELGIVSRETLVEGLKIQAQLVTATLFQWWGGSFEFLEEPVPFPDEVMIGFNLNSMIMEAAKAVDDWARVRQQLPDLEVVVRPVLLEGETQTTLTCKEWNALSFIDGKRNIIEIADMSPLPDVETCLTISDLVERNLVEIIEAIEPNPTTPGSDVDRSVVLLGIYNELFAQIFRFIRTSEGETIATTFSEALWSYCTSFSPMLDRSWRPVMGNFDVNAISHNLKQIDPDGRTHNLASVLQKILKEEIVMANNVLSDPQISALMQQLVTIADILTKEIDNELPGIELRTKIMDLLSPTEVLTYEERPTSV